MKRSLYVSLFVAVFFVAIFSTAAITKINLATQISGILGCGNGGTGAASTSANYVLAGPSAGSAACPSFVQLTSAYTQAEALYNTKRYARMKNSGAGMGIFGDSLTTSGMSSLAATSTDPARSSIATTTTSGNVASISTALNYLTGRNIEIGGYQKLAIFAGSAGDNERAWICLTDQTASTMGAADAPSGNYACFRYSSGASDGTWQCVTSTGASQQIQSSGAANDTNYHVFYITFNDSSPNVVFQIDGSTVCTNTLHLPASSTLLRGVWSITTLTTAARSTSLSWGRIGSDL